jgi:ATP-dependent helicase/nuclease subunit A
MTPMKVIEFADAQQREASDPGVSAFVAASAGSGKTKLLTDRLLRLMLAGTAPDKILCLTYTKAAAAEMTIRLNKRLGDWVVMDRPGLERALRALDVPVNEANVTLARKLFADVLDLPGGMRIETIHAFCQSLLRRFPLEASLSPHFEVADEVQEGRRLREAREAVLAQPGHEAAIYTLAGETNEPDFAALTQKFAQMPAGVLHVREAAEIAAMQRAALGAGDESEAALRAQAVLLPREAPLRAGLRLLAERGNKSGQAWAYEALDWLAQPQAARAARWDDWLALHFIDKGKGTPNKLHNFFGKGLAAEEPGIRIEIAAECQRIEAAREQIRTAQLTALNASLMQLAAPIVQNDATQKQLAAQLSYADLVRHTATLFEDPGASWILYKLDGGIEHLLLDEVQDTAPAQWEIAAKIADEFFAGAGARESGRTIFAVGDAKQSIFSFQGADLESFETYRAKFRAKVKAAGQRWVDGNLSVSFRSTAPVLALVDAVFATGPARAGVCRGVKVLKHEVSRAGQAGWVELWPLSEAAPAAELPPWAVPEDYEGADSPRALLARQIAIDIEKRLAAGEILKSQGRPVRPGDFLILVRRRDALVSAITRECKARGVPVAGLDRMVLTAQLAVSDLLALCDALLLGDDNLAFAQYLASPLGGLNDESLMALAMGRERRSLLAALYARHAERADWAAAKAFFEALRAKVDFLSPFALLSEALGPLGGRSRILRRLGPEAAEPVDEFLTEALKFTQSEPGALQLFVHQLRQAGAQIKREAEAGGDVVRIMTVHGAKGLQAPIVILPDTTALPTGAQKETLFWLPVPGEADARVPVFCPRTALRAAAVASAAADAAAAQAQEYNRLLYVALTRAEDGLIICGAKGRNNLAEASWYALVRDGFERLPEVAEVDGRLVHACAQSAPPAERAAPEAAHEAALPGWAGAAPGWVAAPPGVETTRPERIAPSRGVEDIARQALAASPLGTELAQVRAARAAAMARGRAVHALLQHLPDLPPPERAAAAARFIASVPELAEGAAQVSDSVLAILHNPALAALFGPGSRAEVPLAGVVGDVEIGGLVDRLAVTAQRVMIADYKTDRAPPDALEAIPPGYLRQLAAYRAILTQIYPRHAVACLLIWTQSAVAMKVPDEMLDAHAPA